VTPAGLSRISASVSGSPLPTATERTLPFALTVQQAVSDQTTLPAATATPVGW
jgi:hypothetical protein